MDADTFEPKYNVIAAHDMFNRALADGDFGEAREIALICIDAQESENGIVIEK